MDKMLQNGRPEQIGCVTQAFLKMKKFDIGELRRAYEAGAGDASTSAGHRPSSQR
jgi:hypothetical protein